MGAERKRGISALGEICWIGPFGGVGIQLCKQRSALFTRPALFNLNNHKVIHIGLFEELVKGNHHFMAMMDGWMDGCLKIPHDINVSSPSLLRMITQSTYITLKSGQGGEREKRQMATGRQR